jgi:hypothetical protein
LTGRLRLSKRLTQELLSDVLGVKKAWLWVVATLWVTVFAISRLRDAQAAKEDFVGLWIGRHSGRSKRCVTITGTCLVMMKVPGCFPGLFQKYPARPPAPSTMHTGIFAPLGNSARVQ